MRNVMDHYGIGILELIATIGMIAILFACTGKNGTLSNIVALYLKSICG